MNEDNWQRKAKCRDGWRYLIGPSWKQQNGWKIFNGNVLLTVTLQILVTSETNCIF